LIDPDLLENRDKRSKLELWTIAQLRWPLLAEYLEKDYETANILLKGLQAEQPED